MVLLVIVVAMVVTGIVAALRGSADARSGAISDAAMTRVTTAINDDVARAMTADRDAARLRDPVELARAITRHEPAYSTSPADPPGTVLDIDDVVDAQPDRFSIRVDADKSVAGAECVTWRASSTDGTFAIERLVDPGASCGSGSIARTTFVSAPADVAGINLEPFSYDLVCAPASCDDSGASDPAAPCRPWTVSSVPASQVRRVVAVRATITAATAQSGSASRSDGTSSSTIRSRDTATYREALGC